MHRFFSSSLATPSQAVLYFDLSLLKVDLHVSFIYMSSSRLRLAGEVKSRDRSFRSYGLRKFFGVGSGPARAREAIMAARMVVSFMVVGWALMEVLLVVW
jgi:hypothetical protein